MRAGIPRGQPARRSVEDARTTLPHCLLARDVDAEAPASARDHTPAVSEQELLNPFGISTSQARQEVELRL